MILLCVAAFFTCFLYFAVLRRSSRIEWEKFVSDTSRPLGNNELLNVIWARNVNPVTAIIILSGPSCISLNTVKQLLIKLMNRHPMLRMTIDQNKDTWVFRPMKDAQPEVEIVENEDVTTFVDDNQFDDENGPLWKCKLFPNIESFVDLRQASNVVQAEQNDEGTSRMADENTHTFAITFHFHHAIIDGMGVANVVKEFVHLLNGHCEHLNENLLLSPPLEYFVQKQPINGFRRKLIYYSMRLSFLNWIWSLSSDIFKRKGNYLGKLKRETSKSVNGAKSNDDGKTKVLLHKFSKSETTKFLAACKMEGVSVQGTLQTACCTAVAKMTQDAIVAGKTMEINFSVSINCRNRLSEDLEEPNVLLASLPIVGLSLYTKQGLLQNPNLDEFWHIASRSTMDLHNRLMRKDYLMGSYYLDARAEAGLLRKSKAASLTLAPGDIYVSNLGKWKYQLDKDDLYRTDACHVFSASYDSGPIISNQFITVDDHLYMTVSCYSKNLTLKELLYYQQRVKEIIIRVVNG